MWLNTEQRGGVDMWLNTVQPAVGGSHVTFLELEVAMYNCLLQRGSDGKTVMSDY